MKRALLIAIVLVLAISTLQVQPAHADGPVVTGPYHVGSPISVSSRTVTWTTDGTLVAVWFSMGGSYAFQTTGCNTVCLNTQTSFLTTGSAILWGPTPIGSYVNYTTWYYTSIVGNAWPVASNTSVTLRFHDSGGYPATIWPIYAGAPTATPTATATATPGVTSYKQILHDGDMEINGYNPWWGPLNPNLLFGRLRDGNWFNGDDACKSGSGYQAIGLQRGWPWESGQWGGIYQTFDWPGGDLYWSFTAKALVNDASTNPPNLRVYLQYTSTVEGDPFGTATLYDADVNVGNWQVYTNTEPISLTAGTYQIVIDSDWNRGYTVYVDDVALAVGVRPQTCSNPTGYGAGPGATPTPLSTEVIAATVPFTNCDFENGLLGWGSNPETMYYHAADNIVTDAHPEDSGNAPVGPHYAIPDWRDLRVIPQLGSSPRPLWHSITWAGGQMYVVFFAIGKPHITISRAGYGQVTLIDSPAVFTEWTKFQVIVNAGQSGDYLLALYGSQTTEISPTWSTGYDGFTISTGSFKDTCSQYPTPTPTTTPKITATPSPSYTPSKTPTGTIRPSRTPTRTPIPSRTATPLPSWTAQPSRTARATSTMVDTATMIATHTGIAPEGTFTPWPTYTPLGTYTPYPTGTPAPWGTPAPPSDPGPVSLCEMPDDWYNVSAWVDFEMCRLFRFISWSPENDRQVAAMSEDLQSVEPYGTLKEFYDSLIAVREVWNSYDWINTGFEGKYDVSRPQLEALTLPALDSGLTFQPDTAFDARVTEEVEFCKQRTTTVFGQNVSNGMCVVWTYYYLTGVVQWIQFFWDLAALYLLVRYLYRALFTRG